jgi:hypothetical protein
MAQRVTQAGSGGNAAVEAQVDPTHKAARVSLRPIEPGVLGSYQAAFVSGLMAAGLAAGSPIFAFRWTTAGLICIPRRVRLVAMTDATAFAPGSSIFDLIRASSFSAQYTGGAVVNLLGKSNVKATRMGASQQQINNLAIGNIAVASTATLVAGAPAPTLDNNAMSILLGSVGAFPLAWLTPHIGYLIDPTEAVRTPLELMLNEGFVIRATVPITGTWKFGVEVDWDEVDPAVWLK